MRRQLALDLGRRPALGRDAFLVSSANAAALAAIDAWERWPGGKQALVGAAGTGKTHLAHVWAESAGALVVPAAAPGPDALDARLLAVEDVGRIAGDRAAEERLFHIHNAVLARGGRLLLTGRAPPSRWPLVLPDLASRVAAAGVARLDPPDEALMAGVLLKLFADRHIRPRPGLIGWLVPRLERSFAAAEAAVARLDQAALSQNRAVGVRLAARTLQM
ncbi:chromosomal replication initiator DnaA [Rhodobacteraceae bacterium 2CG4]|uniref:Chromosomal replication initiator DnaA n=1 Tax=Halovulum marinum TaxID=2662447 RepID=A0A6L5Z5P1_9RHOB|nr:DnaA/Hda family protein [Halovulum marinum]MSU91364.1 chromosomal replication initiator DnaA [Halovulum marinum]